MVDPTMGSSYKNLHAFFLPTRENFPTDWDSLFGRSAPLEVEIGFGDGEYLVRCAQEEPEKNWLGLELRWSCVRNAIRKIGKEGVRHVQVMKLDGRAVLKYLFSPPIDIRNSSPVSLSLAQKAFRREADV